MPHSTAQTDAYLYESRFILVPGLQSHGASQSLFSLYDDRRKETHELSQPCIPPSKKLEKIRGGLHSRALPGLADRAEDGLHAHTMAKVRVDKARFDATILADDQSCRDRQQPPPVPLELLEIDPEREVGLLDLISDPEHEAERKSIGQIEVGQHPEREIPALFQ